MVETESRIYPSSNPLFDRYSHPNAFLLLTNKVQKKGQTLSIKSMNLERFILSESVYVSITDNALQNKR